MSGPMWKILDPIHCDYAPGANFHIQRHQRIPLPISDTGFELVFTA